MKKGFGFIEKDGAEDRFAAQAAIQKTGLKGREIGNDGYI